MPCVVAVEQSDYEAFARQTGLTARGWRDGLASAPSHTQDLVHTQAYFVRPLLRITLAFLWLASAFAGFLWAQEWSAMLAQRWPAFRPAIGPVLIGASLLDLAIAVLLLVRWRPRALARPLRRCPNSRQ